MYAAAQQGHLEVVRLLLDKGAKKEAATKVGWVQRDSGCLAMSRLVAAFAVE